MNRMMNLLVIFPLVVTCSYASANAIDPSIDSAMDKSDDGSSVNITYIDVSNQTEIQQYANLLSDNLCVPFHPEMKEPIDAHSLDPETLYTFMIAYAGGDLVELCTPKDQENIGTQERAARRPRPGPGRGFYFLWFNYRKKFTQGVIISSTYSSKWALATKPAVSN